MDREAVMRAPGRRRPGARTAALALAAGLVMSAPPASALDLDALWDFGQPARSEQRFRAALADAQGDEALILQTQIARSHGLRGDFDQARAILAPLRPALAGAGAEARVRFALEWGRSWVSAAHPPDALTAQALAEARAAYGAALDMATAAHLDALAVDALHMMAFVDPAPADQLRWGQAALALALASDQPRARRWEASLRNNIGYALHQLGRPDLALPQLQQAQALRERQGNPQRVREARWMVAWCLRALHRDDEALAIQLQLAHEGDAVGRPDPEVFEELALLYRGRGDEERARHFERRRAAVAGPR
jgi:tetratricopeptide (TPR) repeat protein